MMFGIRWGSENHKLKWSDIQLLEYETGREYLEFTDSDTKTRTGEITHLRAFQPKQYSTPDDRSNCQSLHIRLFGITGLLPPRPLIVPFILPSITSVSKVLPLGTKINL